MAAGCNVRLQLLCIMDFKVYSGHLMALWCYWNLTFCEEIHKYDVLCYFCVPVKTCFKSKINAVLESNTALL